MLVFLAMPNEHPINSDLYLCSIKMHEQRKTKQKNDDKTPEGAVPAYLLDREGQSRAKVLSNMIKQKRKEKAVSHGCVAFHTEDVLLLFCGCLFYGWDKCGCNVVGFVSCRASGKCPCQRCEPRERQKCSKSSEPERDKRRPGREWSPKSALSATVSPVNPQSTSVSSDPW